MPMIVGLFCLYISSHLTLVRTSGRKASAAENLSLSQGKSQRLGGIIMELEDVSLTLEGVR